MLRSRTFFGRVAALIATTLCSSPAWADGLALDRFDPAPAGDRFFGVQSAYVSGDLTPHVMLMLDYAHDPLIARGSETKDFQADIVRHQMFLRLGASLDIWERLNLNLDVPVAVWQAGDDANGALLGARSPSGAAMGDVRVGARLRLYGEYDDPFQIAISNYIWIPTGENNRFVTDGHVRWMPQLVLGGKAPHLVWAVNAGAMLAVADTFVTIPEGSMVKTGAGLGFTFARDHVQIGPEASFSFQTARVTKETINVEGLIDAKVRLNRDFEVGAGAGPGLSGGIGTPNFRVVGMLAYNPEHERDRDKDGIYDEYDACPDVPGVPNEDRSKNGCPPPGDRDGDRITDDVDACPDVPGVADPDPAKNGCPVLDRDGDGIPDVEDACPDVKGVRNEDPKRNGCPPDRDNDGIPDAEDACPDIPGVPSPDPKLNGCPPDSDGDGIRDDVDACPKEPGPPNADPRLNGCPLVVLTEKEIEIREQVQFDTGKATIKPASDLLLDTVAKVMIAHPEITLIEVQGHTDTQGGPRINKPLSIARAAAVKKSLEKRGVEARRMRSKGYGQDRPIADNNTEAGMALNRRVQFVIITQLQPGEKPKPARQFQGAPKKK